MRSTGGSVVIQVHKADPPCLSGAYRSETAQGHEAVCGPRLVAKGIDRVVFPDRQKIPAVRRSPVIDGAQDRPADFAAQSLTANRSFLSASHGRSRFIQFKDQMGRDQATRKSVRFAAVESNAVDGAAGTTAHARTLVRHGLLPSDGGGNGSQPYKLPPKSDGDPE